MTNLESSSEAHTMIPMPAQDIHKTKYPHFWQPFLWPEQLSNFLRKHLRAACFSPLSDRREVYWQGGHSYQFLSSMQDRPNRLKQCLYQPLSLVAYSSLSIQSASTLPACKTRCRRYPCLPCSRLQLHSCRRGQAPLARPARSAASPLCSSS